MKGNQKNLVKTKTTKLPEPNNRTIKCGLLKNRSLPFKSVVIVVNYHYPSSSKLSCFKSTHNDSMTSVFAFHLLRLSISLHNSNRLPVTACWLRALLFSACVFLAHCLALLLKGSPMLTATTQPITTVQDQYL